MYIGKEPIVGNFQVCDAITVVNGQAAYTLQVSSTNVVPESSHHMLVSLNGILQKNGGSNPSFTVSGSTLTFASNLATGDVIDFVILLGNVLDLGVPSDGTVTPAKLSGVTQGITTASQWRLTSSFSSDATPVASNLEETDTTGQGVLGSSMTQSSGIFTFPSTGYWFVRFTVTGRLTSGSEAQHEAKIVGTTDNSSYADWAETHGSNNGGNSETFASCETIVDVTSTTNVKVRFDVETSNSSTSTLGSSTISMTHMTFIRLGDT